MKLKGIREAFYELRLVSEKWKAVLFFGKQLPWVVLHISWVTVNTKEWNCQKQTTEDRGL